MRDVVRDPVRVIISRNIEDVKKKKKKASNFYELKKYKWHEKQAQKGLQNRLS